VTHWRRLALSAACANREAPRFGERIGDNNLRSPACAAGVGGDLASAIGLASAAPSKIRARAELVLRLRVRSASYPSASNRRRALDSGDAGAERLGDAAVAPAFPFLRRIRFRNDARIRQQLRRTLAPADQNRELLPLLRAQSDYACLDGDPSPRRACRLNRTRTRSHRPLSTRLIATPAPRDGLGAV